MRRQIASMPMASSHDWRWWPPRWSLSGQRRKIDPVKFAFIVDPLEGLKAYKDSSVAMMRVAATRGHEVWTIQRPDLYWRDGHVAARALRILPSADNAQWFVADGESVCRLTEFDAVQMRQDPPFDAEYVAATWLLDRAEAEGARIWNRPSAIRDHSEKVALAEFHEFAPTTLFTGDMAMLQGFIDELQDVVGGGRVAPCSGYATLIRFTCSFESRPDW